jgi:hypothetical protein
MGMPVVRVHQWIRSIVCPAAGRTVMVPGHRLVRIISTVSPDRRLRGTSSACFNGPNVHLHIARQWAGKRGSYHE